MSKIKYPKKFIKHMKRQKVKKIRNTSVFVSIVESKLNNASRII